jgi:hypothetical protein
VRSNEGVRVAFADHLEVKVIGVPGRRPRLKRCTWRNRSDPELGITRAKLR